MEPADLNSPANANDDARLEALLRRASPLPDDGFSTRVLATLPEAKTENAPWLRIAFCIAGAVAGCGFALWRGGSWLNLKSSAERFAAVFANAAPTLANPWMGVVLVVTVLSLLVVFRAELREKLML